MKNKRLLAIDPGTTESAFVLWDGDHIIDAMIMANMDMLDYVATGYHTDFVVEKVESYGMPVGATVFETVFWAGRFVQAHAYVNDVDHEIERHSDCFRLTRRQVKLHLCGSSRAKDGNIRQAIIDRFGPVPTKARPNPVYDGNKIKKDEWAAFALAVTWWDATQRGQTAT